MLADEKEQESRESPAWSKRAVCSGSIRVNPAAFFFYLYFVAARFLSEWYLHLPGTVQSSSWSSRTSKLWVLCCLPAVPSRDGHWHPDSWWRHENGVFCQQDTIFFEVFTVFCYIYTSIGCAWCWLVNLKGPEVAGTDRYSKTQINTQTESYFRYFTPILFKLPCSKSFRNYFILLFMSITLQKQQESWGNKEKKNRKEKKLVLNEGGCFNPKLSYWEVKGPNCPKALSHLEWKPARTCRDPWSKSGLLANWNNSTVHVSAQCSAGLCLW